MKGLNVQHPTLNIERRMKKIRYWFSSLEVGSSMLDVRSVEKINDQHPTLNIEC